MYTRVFKYRIAPVGHTADLCVGNRTKPIFAKKETAALRPTTVSGRTIYYYVININDTGEKDERKKKQKNNEFVND